MLNFAFSSLLCFSRLEISQLNSISLTISFKTKNLGNFHPCRLYPTTRQLPTPTWAANEEECKELFQWYKDRGLPVPIGGNFNGVSLKRRIAKW